MEPPTPAGPLARVPRAPDRAIELPMTLLVPRHHARGRSAPPQNAGSVTVGRAPCATTAPVEAVGGGRPAPGSTGPCSSGSRAGTTRAASTPRSATAPPPVPPPAGSDSEVPAEQPPGVVDGVVLEDGVRVIGGLSKPVQCLPLRALIHRQGQKISGGEVVGVIVDPVALAVHANRHLAPHRERRPHSRVARPSVLVKRHFNWVEDCLDSGGETRWLHHGSIIPSRELSTVTERRVRVTLAAEQSGASGMLSQTRSSGSLGARLHL